jgi:pilus assembly protein Flp/PilA
MLKRFLRDESGATAIEYGILASGVAVAIIVAVQSVGTGINDTLGTVETAIAPPAP